MTITTDTHVHCFPVEMVPEGIQRARAQARAARLGRDAAYVETMVGRMVGNIDDREGGYLRRDLEAAGIERATLIGLDWGLVLPDDDSMPPAAQLEWAAGVLEAHAGFFTYLFGVDPRRPDAVDVAREALDMPGVAGLKLYPPAGFPATDERCDALYREAVRRDVPVMFHTGRQTYPFSLLHGRLEQYGEVQRRHPDLRLVLGHAGYPLWGPEAVVAAAGHARTVLEMSQWQKLLGSEPERVRSVLVAAFSELGPSRVLFGSDIVSGPRSEEGEVVRAWRDFFEAAAAEAGVDVAESERAARALLH